MPDINPAAGDHVEITIIAPSGTPAIMYATLKTKEQSGQYQIELNGNPTMRGLININDYEWSHEHKRWLRRKTEEKRMIRKPNAVEITASFGEHRS
jgi:hypothetical protein